MDNASRSERSRNAALQAALTIIARDGPGRLTLDAIARESGMSKGAVTHQFHTKEGVLQALIEQQMAHFQAFSEDYLERARASHMQPELAAQIATIREAVGEAHSLAFAVLGALVNDPNLLAATRQADVEKAKLIEAEAADPDLALLRWKAAWGLAFTAMFGLCPLSDAERQRLFERLLDDGKWSALAAPEKPAASGRRKGAS